ncbi:MAG: sugar transferase [Candidatus Pacebacteria bacterium]|nr:sugar transferase [Candidatus Paceibacterota bacterium]
MKYDFLKRMMDLAIFFLILPFFILIFPFVALAIKAGSRGPVFYKAKRVSGGKIITIYKFRTMFLGSEKKKKELNHLNERKDGPFFKISNDPRVTNIGRILRKFWIDETPQIFNVFKDEISFVGPRPYEPEEIEKYPTEYKFLKNEKAGITGLSQIKGSSNLPFSEVLKYDAYYARCKNLRLDLKIIFQTFLLLFNPSGV